VGVILRDDPIRPSCQCRSHNVAIARVNCVRDALQMSRRVCHRLWKVCLHQRDPAPDSAGIQPSSNQASLEFVENLAAPDNAKHPALAESKDDVRHDVRM
jgi:hypothetical protein